MCAAQPLANMPDLQHFATLAGIIFLDAFKPSEPHLVPYLVQVKRFSEQQVRFVRVPIRSGCSYAYLMHATCPTSATPPASAFC